MIQPLRVSCVDDNEFVVEALQRRIGREPGLEFAGSAECADDLIALVDRDRPGLLLIDMNMPGRDPVDAIGELKRERPSVRIVALSGYVREDMIDRVLAAGADGYIAKDEELETIVNCLKQAGSGEVIFSPLVLKHYAGSGGTP